MMKAKFKPDIAPDEPSTDPIFEQVLNGRKPDVILPYSKVQSVLRSYVVYEAMNSGDIISEGEWIVSRINPVNGDFEIFDISDEQAETLPQPKH